eukprot:359587-Chlamydomonas_euryale.AAC.3
MQKDGWLAGWVGGWLGAEGWMAVTIRGWRRTCAGLERVWCMIRWHRKRLVWIGGRYKTTFGPGKVWCRMEGGPAPGSVQVGGIPGADGWLRPNSTGYVIFQPRAVLAAFPPVTSYMPRAPPSPPL